MQAGVPATVVIIYVVPVPVQLLVLVLAVLAATTALVVVVVIVVIVKIVSTPAVVIAEVLVLSLAAKCRWSRRVVKQKKRKQMQEFVADYCNRNRNWNSMPQLLQEVRW